MNTVHHVIFDLDGTLSDSAVLTLKALDKIAPAAGLPKLDIEVIRAAVGYANPEFYYRLFPNYPRDMVLKVGVEVENAELDILPQIQDSLLFNGVREMLEEFHSGGVNLYIASTGDAEHVNAVVDGTGIRQYFNQIVCGQPAKQGMISSIMGDNPPEEFLMVGDMLKDSEGAAACGVSSVGACYGYCVKEKSEFDHYIDTPIQLLDFLR